MSEKPITGITDPIECEEYCQKDVKCFYFAVNQRNDPIEKNGCWLKEEVDLSKITPRVGVGIGLQYCGGKPYLFHLHEIFKHYYLYQKEVISL